LKKALPLFLLSLWCSLVWGQQYGYQYQVFIKKASSTIEIDGVLDEQAWLEADKAQDFHQNYPIDTIMALSASEVSFTYDQDNLYIGIVCYDPIPGDYVVTSLRRDWIWPLNDNMSIYIDPFDDLTNGFTFGITPLGIQREGLVTFGVRVSSDWDNKWYSATKNHDDRWVAELKIPFKSIRYNDQLQEWNIQMLRNDQKQNERSVWTPVPQQFRPSSFAFAGKLMWDEPPPPAGPNISLIPYASGSVSQDFEDNEDIAWGGDVGMDAKIALSSSLNLDLTVNPDFSQVEVDQQVTNLDRFELFFPERRQFFLENSDLFGNFGFPRSRVFFSRRVGLANPILFGARLSGKVDKNWRVGLLNVQTLKVRIDDDDDIPTENFTVATFQRQLFGRSNLAGVFLNKQAINFNEHQQEGYDFGDTEEYNRVFGLEYNLLTTNNKWIGDTYYFRSMTPGVDSDNYAHGTFLRRNTRNLELTWSHELIGDNYQADAGFVPRTGFYRMGPSVRARFFPSSEVINRHGPELEFDLFTDTDFEITDHYLDVTYQIQFLNTSGLFVGYENNFVKLLEDFDPTNSDEEDTTIVPLPEGSEYNWQGGILAYESDRRKSFSYALTTSFGGFYNGEIFTLEGELNFRIRPIFTLGVIYSFNTFSLPDPFPDDSFWLVGPRIDFTFTDKIFLTTFVQYNEQDDNLNINTRFQWRFKPVSDLFIVYTDNYFPDGLQAKNRALVIKLSYWLNI